MGLQTSVVGMLFVVKALGFEPFADVDELRPANLKQFCGPRDAKSGLASCKHSVRKTLDDEGEVALDWHVKVDPETILSVDADEGFKLVACSRGELRLVTTQEHAEKVKEGTIIVASRFAHACGHAKDQHIFDKIVEVKSSQWKGAGSSRRLVAHVLTKSHHDFADVLPHISFNFSYMPIEARDVQPYPKMRTDFGQGLGGKRRLTGFDTRSDMGDMESHQSSDMGVDMGGGLLKFSPKQLSNFGFNWDFFMNSTDNPEFNYSFPGMEGYMMLKQPYIKIHAGLFFNFTSHFEGLMRVPKVQWKSGLIGHGVINARMITDFRSTKDVSEDAFHMFTLPALERFEEPIWLSKMDLAAGAFPVSVEPGFQFQAEIYHKGNIDGTLQLGGKTFAQFFPITEYSSDIGLRMSVKADFKDTEIYPPLWIVATDHFEMGIQFEPVFWLRGQFGRMSSNSNAPDADERIGMEIRPYLNVSLKREGMSVIGDHKRMTVAYPFRVIGLDTVAFSQKYQVQVEWNGKVSKSTPEMNWGDVDVHDHLDVFNFGESDEKTVLTEPFTISLWEVDASGATDQLGSTELICDSILNGECQPMPALVQFSVDGNMISIELAVLWLENPIPWFASRIRGVDWSFPQVVLNKDAIVAVLPELANGGAPSKDLNLRVTHASKSHTITLSSYSSVDSFLAGTADIEFGPTFLDSWHPCGKPNCESAKMELFYGAQLLGSSPIPEIPFQSVSNIVTVTPRPEGSNSFANIFDGSEGLLSKQGLMKTMETMMGAGMGVKRPDLLPLSLSLGAGGSSVAVVHSVVRVMDPSLAASFLSPAKPKEIGVGGQDVFVWTVSDVEEGAQYTFKLSPYSYTGSTTIDDTTIKAPTIDSLVLTPIVGAEEQMTASCSRNPIYGVTADTAPCSFSHLFSFPLDKFPVGTHVVLIVSWTQLGLKHVMQSPPFKVVTTPPAQTSRRLWTAEDWNERLAANSASCDKDDLDFDLQYGTMARARVVSGSEGNPLLPMLSEGMQNVLMSTGFQSLGEDDVVDSDIKQLLPDWLCEGGVCSGKMPGCTQANFEILKFPVLTYNFNRQFIFNDMEEGKAQMRMMTAYAFSMLPEAIEIVIAELNKSYQEAQTVGGQVFVGASTTNVFPWPSFSFGGAQRSVGQQPTGQQVFVGASTTMQFSWPVFNAGSGQSTNHWRRMRAPPDAARDASEETMEAPASWTGTQVTVRFPKGVPFVMDRPLVDMMLRHGMFSEVEDSHTRKGLGPINIVSYHLSGGGEVKPHAPVDTPWYFRLSPRATNSHMLLAVGGLAAAGVLVAIVSTLWSFLRKGPGDYRTPQEMFLAE